MLQPYFEKVDSLYFDHHLTTTVQFPFKTPKKPVVTTTNGLFLVLGVTVQNQQNSRLNVDPYCPVVVLGLQRSQVRIQSAAYKEAHCNVILQCAFLFV